MSVDSDLSSKTRLVVELLRIGVWMQRGGPFGDRSGGMILFEAPDDATAQSITLGDPFARGDVLAESWRKSLLAVSDS